MQHDTFRFTAVTRVNKKQYNFYRTVSTSSPKDQSAQCLSVNHPALLSCCCDTVSTFVPRCDTLYCFYTLATGMIKHADIFLQTAGSHNTTVVFFHSWMSTGVWRGYMQNFNSSLFAFVLFLGKFFPDNKLSNHTSWQSMTLPMAFQNYVWQLQSCLVTEICNKNVSYLFKRASTPNFSGFTYQSLQEILQRTEVFISFMCNHTFKVWFYLVGCKAVIKVPHPLPTIGKHFPKPWCFLQNRNNLQVSPIKDLWCSEWWHITFSKFLWFKVSVWILGLYPQTFSREKTI